MHQRYNRAQAKTHPWDGDIEDTRSRLVWFSLLLVALLLILSQSLSAQRVFPMPDPDVTDTEGINSDIQLSRAELQAANDYKDIISDLEFLIRNHLSYFADYKNFEGQKYQNLLLKMLIKIEKGSYYIDVDKLSENLSQLTSSLKTEEKTLKKDKSLRKLYKNVRTLRYDLERIKDVLNEDIEVQLSDYTSSLPTMKLFLLKERQDEKQQEDYQIKMYKLQEQLNDEVNSILEAGESLQITFDETQMRELLETEKLQKELEQILDFVFTIDLPQKMISIKISTDSLKKEISIPDKPAPPSPPEIPQDIFDNRYSDKTVLSNQYQDSIFVKSSRIPIFINNYLGDIKVVGWDRNKVTAEYSYEVISDNNKDAKDFLESVTLELKADKSGIHISSEFPSLHDTKIQVANSQMLIFVPKRNTLDITNSFGTTEVSKIKNNLTLSTKNSDIIVENIYGNINSTGKNGSYYFNNINGNMKIKSNRGKVVVENSNSNLTISNTHAPILVSDCRGNSSLTNSGEITVFNHIGNLDIKNKNGKTTIKSLTGALTLVGSFKPFIISSVVGSVNIKNKNSSIMLSEIVGKTIVKNKNGNIKAHNIQGTIDFSNYGGETYFVANNSLRGSSVIRSDYGMINIVLPKQSNISLQASTNGGSISNSFNTKIEKKDFLTRTSVALGNKSEKLQVTGTNATIIIKDSQ